jgi:hypothetical protein
MINREIRGLMEWATRLHVDTQRACEKSRNDRRKALDALSRFQQTAALADLGLTEVGCDRPVPAALLQRSVKPRQRLTSRDSL